MSDSGSTTPEKKTNWTKILLVVSLALNVLIVTAVGSAIYKNNSSDGPGGVRGNGQIEMMLRALPEEERRELRRSFMQSVRGKDARSEMQERRKAVMDALLADPFDADALTAALEEQRNFRTGLAADSEALWVDVFSNLSEAERAEFRLNLKEMSKRGKSDRKKRDKP